MAFARSRLKFADRTETVAVLPAAGVVAVWIALMPAAGGFAPRDWLPAGLALLGLLVVGAFGRGALLPEQRAARLVLGAFAAFTALNFLSIAWSDAPADAWEAANLLLTTLIGGWALTLVPWRARTASLLLGAFSAGAAAICAVALVRATSSADLSERFVDGRWDQPLEYPNTAAAFALMAAVPALVAAARTGLPVVVSSLAQAGATFLVAFGLLPQSRGSVIGACAAVAVLIAIGPNRWRLALHAAALAATVALVAAGTVLDVYTTAVGDPGRTSRALGDAANAILLAAAVGGLAGMALALAAARLRMDARGRRRARTGGLAASAAAAVTVLAVAAVNAQGIGGTLEDQWRSLTSPGARHEQASAAGNRLTDTDPLQRGDYWRVSLGAFTDRPFAGIGAGQFRHRYVAERREVKVSKYPHNVVLRVLGENGLAGGLLLVGAGLALAAGFARRRRSASAGDRAVAAAAIGVTTYFLAHGLFDWLEAYPVLVWPAFAFPLVALVVLERSARLRRLTGALSAGAEPAGMKPGGPSQPVAAPADAGEATRAGDDPAPDVHVAALPAALRPRSRHAGRRASRAASGKDRRRAPSLPATAAAARATAGAVAVAAAASLLLPWLAVRYQDRAVAAAKSAPAAAVADFERAADLNPLDPRPLVLEGVLTLTSGDFATAKSAFERALAREPSHLPHIGLAVIARRAGDRRTAERHLAAATALDALDPAIPEAARRIRGAGPVDPAAVMRDALTSPLFADERLS